MFKKFYRKKIEKSLKSKKIQFIWHTSKDNQIEVTKVKSKKMSKKINSDLIAGIGGGRSVDTAKIDFI